MKRLAIITFCSLLAMQFVGINAYMVIQKMILFEQMHAEALRSSPFLEHFSFSKTDFSARYHNEIPDELEIDSKMYDVLFSKQEGNIIVLHVIHDTAEDELLAFVKSFGIDSADSRSLPAIALDLITLQYISSQFIFSISRPYSIVDFEMHFTRYCSTIRTPISPPPKDTSQSFCS